MRGLAKRSRPSLRKSGDFARGIFSRPQKTCRASLEAATPGDGVWVDFAALLAPRNLPTWNHGHHIADQ